MNRIVVSGRLCADPDFRATQSGVSRCTFRIAVPRRFKNADGNTESDFITVVCWRSTADFAAKYLTKGRKVAVDGSFQTRSYDAQDGSKRTVYEIIADSVEALDRAGDAKADAETAVAVQGTGGFTDFDDDELPF